MGGRLGTVRCNLGLLTLGRLRCTALLFDLGRALQLLQHRLSPVGHSADQCVARKQSYTDAHAATLTVPSFRTAHGSDGCVLRDALHCCAELCLSDRSAPCGR